VLFGWPKGDAGLVTNTKEELASVHSDRKRRRRWRLADVKVDLSQPKHRRNVLLGFVVLSLLGMGFLYGGLQAIHYAESSEFCGSLCHPMSSEYVRYELSPHAKVECAQCHVGAGVNYFIQSKLDGARSLYYALSDTYERPIKSPVHNLRPARETCEECHTPNAYTDNIIKTIRHYDNDEANTPLQSTVILKMGGWQESTGISEGIHWHITNPVYYIAADEQRQVIMWVGTEQEDGSLKEYYARDMLGMAQTSFVEESRANGEVREMDCIDCHNRSAHLIPPPDRVVDDAISAGKISTDLPFIRAKAVEVLTPRYTSMTDAYEAIEGLMDYYQVGFPAVYENQRHELRLALNTLKDLYQKTNFPEMELNWQTNPDNETHSPFLGCFRCHDGKHALVDPEGNEVEIISVKCNLCHTVPIVGRGTDMLIEAPVIVGAVPESHSDFRYTIEHRTTTEAEREECYQCHGQGFCKNEACHSLAHPPDMLYTHSDEYRRTGNQVCYTCHQDILCSRCHPGGVVGNP
jgi:nitrate/TMAO reductase-like tetraheme cytochrome c subunit